MIELSVVVVDDELPVRQEFFSFPWGKYGCKWVGEAKNGKEALEICREKSPNIVITDITMPVMDGITFIEQLKLAAPQTQIIILSAHKDFEYARLALKLDVLDYIVKMDMREKDISQVLLKAAAQINNNELLGDAHKTAQRKKITELIAQLRMGKNPEEKQMTDIKNKLVELGIPLYHSFQNGMLIIDFFEGSRALAEAMIEEYLSRDSNVHEWYPVKENIYAVSFTNETQNSKKALVHLCSKMSTIFASIMEPERIYGFIMPPCDSMDNYYRIYSMIPILRALHFYQNHNIVFGNEDLYEVKSMNEFFENEFWNLASIVETDFDVFENRFTAWAQKNLFEIVQFKTCVVEYIHQRYQSKTIKYNHSFSKKIYDAYSLEEMIALIKYICVLEIKYRNEVRQAMNIIKNEYSGPITLSDIARRVALSPQYLSKLFSEEMGTTFNDYLTAIRIEAARHLLKQGKYKVYEIAQMVGIPNYRYFSTVFRKNTGHSPKISKEADCES